MFYFIESNGRMIHEQGPDFDDLKIFKKMTYKMTEKIQNNDLK
jgi:hypothetical protein